MKIIMSIYHFILYLVLGILLLIAAISILPRIFGITPYVVLSGSMEPAIETGSMAYINQRIDPYKIRTGDIITYQISDNTVTHRVIDETLTAVFTKGDANEEADLSPVSRDSILGKYLFSVPYLGYLYSNLTSIYLFPVLVSLFGVELIISLINLFISKKEEKT